MENSSNQKMIVVPAQSQNTMQGKQVNIMIRVLREKLSERKNWNSKLLATKKVNDAYSGFAGSGRKMRLSGCYHER